MSDAEAPFTIMGVVNVTPDSFSDGGLYLDPEAAIAHGIELSDEGAAILDIGGESTRPGAEPVRVEEELRRVIAGDRGARRGRPAAQISIDTSKAAGRGGRARCGRDARQRRDGAAGRSRDGRGDRGRRGRAAA